MVGLTGKIETRIAVAFGISLAVFVMELIGGFLSGSLALLSDAGHVFADAFSLGLSWYALNLSHRSTNGRATFGYHRVGIMVALINGMMLVVMAVLIFREGLRALPGSSSNPDDGASRNSHDRIAGESCHGQAPPPWSPA
jgi:cobalt-zinc-cadmium efflux system protein